tara:strand:+ start:635 stop:2272 length:1638 start_codon:yes stop_codon:yes gene_type:complete
MGAYENPITVVDTESAKYWAQALTSLGQSAANTITKFNEDAYKKQREIAKANKALNLRNNKNETEYNAKWLVTVNKGLDGKPLDISNDIRNLLMPKINLAAQIDSALDNFGAKQGENSATTAERKRKLLSQKNALETLFTSGTQGALANLIGRQNSQSEAGKTIGEEGGQSASYSPVGLNMDVASTLPGMPNIPYGLDLIEVDGQWNFEMAFSNKDQMDVRRYNLNTDLGPESMILNPYINKPFDAYLDTSQIVKDSVFNLESSVGASLIDGYKPTQIGGSTYNIPQISLERLKNTTNDSLEGIVGGIVKMGNLEMGDKGVGLASVQSWVDDILPDTPFLGKVDGDDKPISYDDYVGELEADPSTIHGLTEESFGRLQEAILYLKHEKLQNSVDRGKPITTDEDPAAIIIDKYKIEKKNKAIEKVAIKLQTKTLPTIHKFNDAASTKLQTYIAGIDGLQVKDASKPKYSGNKEGFMITGPGKPTGTIIHTGMSQAQIKKTILYALGATDEQIAEYDLSNEYALIGDQEVKSEDFQVLPRLPILNK